MSRLLLYYFAFVLFFLPLNNPLNYFFVPLLILTLGFYGSIFLNNKWFLVPKQVVLCFLLTTVVLLAAFAGIQQPINTYEVLRLLLVIWMIPVISTLVQQFGKDRLVKIALVVLCLHSLWSISQFILQRDLGLYWLGESRLSANTTGVAKFNVPWSEQKVIRAYGPYPHANTLGGTLLIGTILTFSLFGKKDSSFLKFTSILLVFGILTSFSRTALAGLALLLVFLAFRLPKQKWKNYRSTAILLMIIFSVFIPLFYYRSLDTHGTALAERFRGYSWAIDLIRHTSQWRGVGPGQYEFSLQQYLGGRQLSYFPWEVEPVHAVPLLLLAEYGGVALLIAAIGVRYVKKRHLMLFTPLIPAFFLDHYLVSQTAALLWMVLLALLVSPTTPAE